MTRYRALPFVLAGIALVGLVLVPVLPVRSGSIDFMHLDLEGPVPKPLRSTDVGPGIPPNCATWHELYPAFCAPHHQDAYEDADGSGTISPCDIIVLNSRPWHVEWVGPTYFTTCRDPQGNTQPVIFEPQTTNTGNNPVCEVWHEIWPQFCPTIHVDSWHDGNANGQLDVCDEIDVQTPTGTNFYHIDRIGCDIIVRDPRTPSKQSTWGWLKDQFLR